MIAVFLLMVVGVIPYPGPDKPPHVIVYKPGYGAMDITEGRAEAIEAFPDVQSCLKPAPEDTAKDIPALYHIDWDKIDNDDEAEICLFRIFKELGTPETVIGWLKYQGFETRGAVEVRGGSSMLHFGYERRAMTIANGGFWSLEGQYPKWPASGVMRYLRRWSGTSQSVSTQWFPDGKLMQVRAGSTAVQLF